MPDDCLTGFSRDWGAEVQRSRSRWLPKRNAMRILLAEDDEALAAFVRKGLEAEHHAVDVSRDGEQALGLALGFDYDLAILDLGLPRLDGVAILQGIRDRKAQLPILILTARSRVEDRVRCLDAGADDYVVKPFSFAELSARVRALLRRGRLPAESVLRVEDLRLDRIFTAKSPGRAGQSNSRPKSSHFSNT